MSLADRIAEIEVETRGAKVLTLDIERMKGSATIEFWDLGDFKNRRIHADDVTLWPRTICAAWKWYDKKAVEFSAEWSPGGREQMLRDVWNAYDTADIVVGHNLQGFDTKKLQSEWWLLGLPMPSPFKTIDTLKAARSVMGMESNTLDAICKRAGIVAKTDRYNVEVARAACDGDKAAQRKIKSYNVGDIHATEALLNALRGWIPNHPHMGALSESENRCPQCGSTDLAENGTYLAVQIRYKQWRCNNCGGNLRSTHHSRASSVRGVR
jgi:hypothetical protein